MVVSNEDIKADTGEIYDAVQDGTTSVGSMLDRASEFVKSAAGTTSGYDTVIRPLTDAMVVNHVMGGVDGVEKNIGSLSVGAKELRSMRNYFRNEANRACAVKGVSLDGLKVLFDLGDS